MKGAWAYAGWLTAAAVAVVAGGLFIWGSHQFGEITQLRAQVNSFGQQIEKLNIALSEKEAAARDLEAKIAEQHAKSSGPSVDAASGETGKPPASLASLLGKMAAAAGARTRDKVGQGGPKGQQGNPLAAFAQMYSGEQGKEMARQSAEMAVNMQYGELFTNLHLPADVEQRLRDMLKENLAEQITAGMEALQGHLIGTQGKSSPEALKRMRDDADAKFRVELGTVLSPDQMAAWDDYEATLPKRMLTQSFEMQLNMFAPGLTPENRTRARDVLVEELLPAEPGQPDMGIPTSTDFQARMNAQQEGFSRARERLAQEFDETQLAHVDRFIAQIQQMAEMSAHMMESTRLQENKPK